MRFAILLAALASLALLACAGGDDGGVEYSVGVQFNQTVQQEDIDEVEAILRGYDQGLEFAVLELFPPEGRATLVTIGLMLPFIHSSVTVGAMNILLLFLVVASWMLVERGREWEAGLPLGLAVLIKLLPAVLIVFFLIKGRWRAASGAIILVVGFGVGLPLATTGPTRTQAYHEEFYRSALVDHSAHATITAEKPRKAKYNNQSLPIVLRRLLSPLDANAGEPEDRFFVNVAHLSGRNIWLVYLALMLIALAAGILPLVHGPSWPPQDADELARARAQFGVWCCLMLIASPLVWTHYFVLALWPLAVVAHRAEAVQQELQRPCRLSLSLLVIWLIADLLMAWPAARAAGVHLLGVIALCGLLAWLGRTSNGGGARFPTQPLPHGRGSERRSDYESPH